MITVNGVDELPPPSGTRAWTYYLRCVLEPAVVVEAFGGEAYRLSNGEWPEMGYRVEQSSVTGRITRKAGTAFVGGDVKKPLTRTR